jgi:hypothetical protein
MHKVTSEQQRSQDEAFIDRSIEHRSTEGMVLFHTHFSYAHY